MRIGFLGNTNNYPFMLARAFRRMGHDVRVIVTRADVLHRPEYRYRDIAYPYPDWIYDIPFSSETEYVTSNAARRNAVRILRECDMVVLNDLGISLAASIGRPYLAMLTGSDLAFYCNPESEERVLAGMTTRNPIKRWIGRALWRQTLAAQRAGVRNAPLIYHFSRGLIPASDRLMDEIGVTEQQRVFFLMAEVQEIEQLPNVRQEQLRAFCATRLTWKTPMLPGDSPLDFKGSDVMIRGIGEFWRRHQRPIEVHLVRKGRHVVETEALIQEVGISDQIVWHDEMSQAEVWRQYGQANVVFEQFGEGLVTMAGLEAMAAGRPVIGNGRPEIIEPMLGELSPICQAKTADEVCRHLERFEFEPDSLAELSARSSDWVRKHFAPERAAEIVLERLAPLVSG